MRNSFFTTILALGLVSNLRADTKLYLLYESSCMEKYESWFTRAGVQAAGDAPLVQYALQPNPNTRVYLEMDGERPKRLDNMPKNTKSCGEVRWDEDLAHDINSGKTDVFLIWKTNSGWSVATVATAALQVRNGSVFTYTERDFNFKLDTAAAFQEDDMANRESNFFVSKKDFFYRECEPVYVLKRDAKKTCEAFTEFEFIPRYGIVQENTGKTAAELGENQLNLYLVDGQNFIEKMKTNCGGVAPAAITYSQSSDYVTEADRANTAATPITYNQIDETRDADMATGGGYRASWAAPAVETSAPSTCNAPEKVGFHLVQKGDNLYRIARQYGLSVSNLKAWNKLVKDDISACSYLAIDPAYSVVEGPKPVESNYVPQKAALKTATPQPKVQPMTAGGGVRVISSPAPAIYSTVTAPKPVHHVEVSTNGWHVIQANENLTIIGAAYGLTATDLAKMNGIARNTILYPGQKLRVSAAVAAEKTTVSVQKTTVKPVVYEYTAPAVVQYVSPQDGCFHSVLEGDNLSKIARTYGYTLERLMRMNGFTDEKMMLNVGQRILVNDCECLKKTGETEQTRTDQAPKSVSGGGVAIRTVRETTSEPVPVKPVVYEFESPVQPGTVRNIYTTVEGDTAPIVARKVKMDVNRFREINNLELGEQLVPGQRLIVE